MIELRRVVKAFEDNVVLKGIDLKVERGETKIVMGASGSGKSTILKLILGLEKADSGQILIDGQDITRMSERELIEVRKKIGMVFQEGALFDSLTVRENVGFRLYDNPRYREAEIDEVVRRLLGFVGLEEAIDMMPAELSGGMKRRVGIARALVGNPRILLYDEPTAGLDPITARTILELMIKLRDLEGVTSLLVTHDLKAARIIANEYATVTGDGQVRIARSDGRLCLLNIRFVMLHEGEIIFEGTEAELYKCPNQYVQNFIS